MVRKVNDRRTESPNSEIKKDVEAWEGGTLDDATIASYLNALEKLYVVEGLFAWNPNLRLKAAAVRP